MDFIKDNMTSVITFLVALIGAIPVIYGMFADRKKKEAESEEKESLAVKNITEAATGLLDPYRRALLEMQEKIVVSDKKVEELQRLNKELRERVALVSGEKTKLEEKLLLQAKELKRMRRINKLLLEQLRQLNVEPIVGEINSSEGESTNGEDEE